MTKERFLHLKEKAEKKGKQLLIEYTAIDLNENKELLENVGIPSLKIELNENYRVTEKINGKEYTCRGIIKNVPVTRFNENKNGRIYPRSLWERIEKKGGFNNRYMLADHADKEGSVKDITAVWRNFRVLNEVCVADLYCVGDYGQLLIECIQAGGMGGVSTVGMGDFLSDGKTVNPDTYDLSEESVCDWVLNPSQSVYATMEENEVIIKDEKTELRNSSVTTTNKIEESVIMNDNIKLEEAGKIAMNEEVKSVLKFQEANIKLRVKESIKESKKLIEKRDIDSLKESKENLKDLLTTIPQTMVEQTLQLQSQIDTLEETISNIAKETSSELNEKSNSLQEALKDKQSFEEKLKEAQEIVDNLKKDTETSSTKYKEALSKAVKDVSIFVEEIKLRDKDIEKFELSFVRMQEDIALLKAKSKKWKEAFDVTLAKLESQRTESDKAISLLEQLYAKHNELIKENSELKAKNDRLRTYVKESALSPTSPKKAKPSDEIAGKLDKKNYDKNNIALDPATENMYDAFDDPKYGKMGESKNKALRTSLEKVYIKESAKHPGLKSIKEEIIGSSSYIDAMSKIDTYLKESFESSSTKKLNENVDKGYYKADWIPDNYR